MAGRVFLWWHGVWMLDYHLGVWCSLKVWMYWWIFSSSLVGWNIFLHLVDECRLDRSNWSCRGFNHGGVTFKCRIEAWPVDYLPWWDSRLYSFFMRLLGVTGWCEYDFRPSEGAYYRWFVHVDVCCYSFLAEVHLWARCDLSRMALSLSRIRIYQICDVLHPNNVWGLLNNLGSTIIVLIVWNGRYLVGCL